MSSYILGKFQKPGRKKKKSGHPGEGGNIRTEEGGRKGGKGLTSKVDRKREKTGSLSTGYKRQHLGLSDRVPEERSLNTEGRESKRGKQAEELRRN